MARVLVTGANGQLGRRLIGALPPEVAIQAVVRSVRAQQMVARHVGARPGLIVTVADPGDVDALGRLGSGCEAAVHLIGAIKESRENPYADSHTRPAQALSEAARSAGVRHIVYLSILGADLHSACRCLRERARVEDILLRAAPVASVIRVPMVLGEGDRASGALARRALQNHVFLLRAKSLEQPIYAGDVITAVMNALRMNDPVNRTYELAGPESLPRRALVARAAAVMNRQPSIHSLPLAFGMAAAAILALVNTRPPITPDMLRVLDHDDAIDPAPAAAALDIALTPLDSMLERSIRHRIAQATI